MMENTTKKLLIGIIISIIYLAVAVYLIKITWNYTMPRITTICNEITMEQSLCLVIFSSIIFGNTHCRTIIEKCEI